ncbi:MAG: xanthine dehydrogenase family protein subunit M [Candidatus Latescibacteria bacterium]|nr:xanthine dehydrogenase family protein subunit M [Candidatus Latescibacterota bacterium]
MYAFDYVAPQTVEEAVAVLSENGSDARMLAGGSDIIAQLKEGRREVKVLVDVKKIPAANELAFNSRQGLTIGAGVSCCDIYENEHVASNYPALVDSTELIGSIQIQGRATIGGNLCNASPAADTIPTLIVLGATAKIAGLGGVREVAVEDFCTAPGQTVLQGGEFLVSLHFPPPAANSGAYFLRFIPRNEMDIAVVNAAASVVLDAGKNAFESARIAVGAVAPVPLYLPAAGAALAGSDVSDQSIEMAAEIARQSARPITDMRGTIEQRVHLAGVLTRRAVRGAVERAS